MKPNKLLTLTASLLLLAGGAQAALNFVGQDVGNPTLKGSVVPGAGGTYTITGGGDDIWNNSDNFYFYYAWASGQQWEAKVRVTDLQGPDNWSKCELMVRQSIPANGPVGADPHISSMTTRAAGQNNVGAQARRTRGGGSENPGGTTATGYPNQWLKVTRTNAVFTVESSFDNVNWTVHQTFNTADGTFNAAWPDVVAVGVAVTAHNDGDLTGGVANVADLSATFPAVTPPTVLGATTQPTNVTVYVGSEATFWFNTTNNAVPNVVGPPAYVSYQWFKNGTAIAGATSTVFTMLAQSGDNGAQIKCHVTINPPYNTTVTGMDSAVATITTQAGKEYQNGLKLEVFAGANRGQVENGNVRPANYLQRLESPDSYGGYGDNTTRRLTGWFIPPTTDTYVFFVSSDDDADLFLSTDATSANKKIIAQENGWSGMRSWLSSGSTGANDAPQKRSDQWADQVTFNNAWTQTTPLTANQKYYIELVSHNGGGGDNFSMTYQTATMMADPNWGTVFSNGTPSIMAVTNNNISLITTPTTFMTWATQPQNISVYEGSAAKWTASVNTDSELQPRFQWFSNDVAIVGATAPSFSFPATLANSGTEVYVVITSAEENFVLTSAKVKLTTLQAVFEKGWAKNEWWWAKTRDQVNNNTAGAPDFEYAVPGFEAGLFNNRNDNFANRLSGFFTPATAGAYDFIVCGDDDTDLFLSTDDKPANKRLIAQESGWSPDRAWTTVGGGSTIEQKQSWTWIPNGGTTASWPNGFALNTTTRYYIELVHHDGTGGEDSSATALIHGTASPVNGTPSSIAGNVLGMFAPRCSYVAFTQQPANAAVNMLQMATFTAFGTTDSTTPVWGFESFSTNNFLIFQWQKNGQDIAGATTSALTYGPVLAADNGAQFICKMRALGLADTALNPVWSNSTTATLTVLQSVWESGFIKQEYWAGGTRVPVENNTAGNPTWTTYIPACDSIDGLADNYARRYSGFFVPQDSVKYAFWINSDDDADLFLSTDDKPANKRLIAQETAWGNGLLRWDATSGNQAQRASYTYVDGTGATPFMDGIQVTANNKYYFEAVQHDGGGGDYLQLLATNVANVGDVVSGSPVNMRGAVIGTYVPKCSYMAFTQQPQSLTVQNLASATFTVAGDTDSQASISPIGQPTLNNKLMYQWYRNGTAIQGATKSTLFLPEVPLADNGAQIVCAIRALGFGDASGNPAWSNSAPAVITVTSTPATAYASTFTDINVTPQVSYLDVAFNKRMNTNGWTTANFQVSGATVTGLVIQPNGKGVKLIVTGTPTPPVTVTLVNVKDADNVAASTAVVTAKTVPLICKDVFVATATAGQAGYMAYPSIFWVDGADAYTVSAQGSDIWDVADGCNFLYEQKTGDFDVVVRQKSISHTSNWAKGGLMVRESLNADSRNWNIVNDPLSSDGIAAPDGSGYGASLVECNARATNAGPTAGWDSSRPAPAYPNAWVRLQRVGEVLKGYNSVDGKNWNLQGTRDLTATPLPATVYVGMCTTAHNNDNPGLTEGWLYYNTVEYADYNSSYIPAATTPTMSASVQAGKLVISWAPAGGTLQSTTALGGTWTDVGTANPATVTMDGAAVFYRVKAQ